MVFAATPAEPLEGDAGALAALREVGGDAARYESPFDPEGWADAIAEAWQEPALRRSAAIGGPSRAQTFSWDRTATQIVAAYNEVLSS